MTSFLLHHVDDTSFCTTLLLDDFTSHFKCRSISDASDKPLQAFITISRDFISWLQIKTPCYRFRLACFLIITWFSQVMSLIFRAFHGSTFCQNRQDIDSSAGAPVFSPHVFLDKFRYFSHATYALDIIPASMDTCRVRKCNFSFRAVRLHTS